MSRKLFTLIAIAAMALMGVSGVSEPAGGANLNSFLETTPVLMADGTRNQIERVVVGDRVLVADPATGELSKREVLEVFAGRGERHMYALTVGGSERPVFATAGHAFHALGRGYTPIERIGRGDVLLGFGGVKVPVQQVEDLGVRPNVTVYNLRVEGPRTFTVTTGTSRIVTYGA